jgi:hypothetical protein
VSWPRPCHHVERYRPRRQLEQQRKTTLSLQHEFVVEARPYLEPSIPSVDGKHLVADDKFVCP